MQHGLPLYHFVLHPRTTGFSYMIQVMRQKSYLKNVYDITVGYPDEIISSELEILRNGRFPHAVHFDVKRYNENDLPQDNTGLINWLNNIWREKEDRLKNFYKADVANRKFLPSSSKKNNWPIHSTGIGYYCAFSFWIAMSIIWIYFIVYFFFVKIYVFFACVFYVYCHWKYAGVQNLAIQLFKQQQQQQQRQQ
ncbi:unnamed protein product [Brugia pahangi]|uniref:Acyltransf_C domain-containing protein n=1 Tax=Brugia pahangi TaxID=6280 RepID=A0A0N4T1Q1_BRUPA|nr:unnamed protein product [Brugia pahangi]